MLQEWPKCKVNGEEYLLCAGLTVGKIPIGRVNNQEDSHWEGLTVGKILIGEA